MYCSLVINVNALTVVNEWNLVLKYYQQSSSFSESVLNFNIFCGLFELLLD